MTISVRAIVYTGLSLLTILFVIALSLHFFTRDLESVEHRQDSLPTTSPRAQVEFESGQTAYDLRHEQENRLKRYRDLGDGFAEIPIEAAMGRLAEKGAWP